MRADRLVVVDSEIQLNRAQKIAGRMQSVRDYIGRRWQHVEAQTVTQFEDGHELFDFALCANVLPLIPRPAQRYRVIALIASRLRPDGRCLFSAQYRNADFRAWAHKANATPYSDGYVVLNPRGASFYGLIDKQSMERHATRGGMDVLESWVHGESAYVLARRAH
jgi:SAM-dependent methyltransferase